MNVLAHIRAGGREIECGLASTRQERTAVQARHFRVYQGRGYYRPGLRADRDGYDTHAAYFLATLRDGDLGCLLLGSARLVGQAISVYQTGYSTLSPARGQSTSVARGR